MTRGTFDLRYIAAAIRSNLLLISAIITVVLGAALVATLLDTPRYTANTTIQINDSSDRVIGENDDQTAQESNFYDVDRFLKTQTDILRSRGLAQRVALKLKLQGRPEFYTAMESKSPGAGASPEAMRNQVVGLLLGNLKVNLPRDSRIVTISFESADPGMSAEIANAFATEFIQSNLQRKFDSSSYAREFVSNQLAEAKQRVEQAERDLNDYSRSTGLIRTGDAAGETGEAAAGGSVTAASLLQLNQAANQATAERVAAEGRWRAISSVPLLSSREVLGNATVSGLMTDRATTQAELQRELSKHLEDYPTVREKRAQLARLDAELQSAAQSVRNSIRAEMLAAQGTEQALMAKLESLKGETLREQDKTVQYGLLKREADTNRTLYDGLLKRYNELNATAGISSSNVSIIDTAEQPSAPTSPNMFKNMLLALLVGVGLAALTLFVKDQLDDAIRVPEDIEAKLRLPLLGVVPKATGRDPDSEMGDPKSPISEAYNSLRAALLYSTSVGLPQVMLVTSAQSAEGKTTTSFAIAASLARMGRKVALIDADLRRPSIHRRFGLPNNRGLTDLLTSGDPVESAILATPQENLFVIASGPIPPSPTELVSSPRMEHLIQELARSHDVVVIDSPPILGLADAPALSALADGVIFVVESERGRRGSLKTALRRLRAMRPILLGAVLTKFDPTRSGNRYSEYYGYQYYTYEQSNREPD
ncbi:polysaccharide biosynthesis tyrosine autokinase [Novosphingobium ginsenosidimutans]|uniref:non-specific protein-tyrosine kinase n=2 Tax=Novosphingobium ginsenosidimutans TaxID=1176536 RepID=A0A5B8SC47_9SPHN|nr:polysaccharide biosynthesis tyrosine autokinase [Novosphingobium ginsenosidimutans]